jgi:hypothetical protein
MTHYIKKYSRERPVDLLNTDDNVWLVRFTTLIDFKYRYI